VSGPYDIYALDGPEGESADSLFVHLVGEKAKSMNMNVALYRPGLVPAVAQYLITDHCALLGWRRQERVVVRTVLELMDLAEKERQLRLKRIQGKLREAEKPPSRDLEDFRLRKVRLLLESNPSYYFKYEDAQYWDLFFSEKSECVRIRRSIQKLSEISLTRVDVWNSMF